MPCGHRAGICECWTIQRNRIEAGRDVTGAGSGSTTGMWPGSGQVIQGGSAQPLGTLDVGAQSLTTFLGLGWPLGCLPGPPPPQAQSLFSAFSPSAAKGCPGRLAGSGGRADGCNIPMLSPRCWDRAMRGGPDSQGPQTTLVLGPYPTLRWEQYGSVCVTCAGLHSQNRPSDTG